MNRFGRFRLELLRISQLSDYRRAIGITHAVFPTYVDAFVRRSFCEPTYFDEQVTCKRVEYMGVPGTS
jgi:hypothetical protein